MDWTIQIWVHYIDYSSEIFRFCSVSFWWIGFYQQMARLSIPWWLKLINGTVQFLICWTLFSEIHIKCLEPRDPKQPLQTISGEVAATSQILHRVSRTRSESLSNGPFLATPGIPISMNDRTSIRTLMMLRYDFRGGGNQPTAHEILCVCHTPVFNARKNDVSRN